MGNSSGGKPGTTKDVPSDTEGKSAKEGEGKTHEESRKRVIEITGGKVKHPGGEEGLNSPHFLMRKLLKIPEMGPLISRAVFENQRKTDETIIDSRLDSLDPKPLQELGKTLHAELSCRRFGTLRNQSKLLKAIEAIDSYMAAKTQSAKNLHLDFIRLASETKHLRKIAMGVEKVCLDLNRAVVGTEALRMLVPAPRPKPFRMNWPEWLSPPSPNSNLNPNAHSNTNGEGSPPSPPILLKSGEMYKRKLPVGKRLLQRHFRGRRKFVTRFFKLYRFEGSCILLADFLSKDMTRPRGKIYIHSSKEVRIRRILNPPPIEQAPPPQLKPRPPPHPPKRRPPPTP
ncbi:hypothetical protein AAMO2058_000622600 [Amorphochlora amoebiformis]